MIQAGVMASVVLQGTLNGVVTNRKKS